MSVVLDTRAILALIYREPGHDRVTAVLPGATASTVTWAEVVTTLARRSHPDPTTTTEAIRALGIEITLFAPPRGRSRRTALSYDPHRWTVLR